MLDDLEGDIYEELHRLRKFRNKVHIQDDIKFQGVSRDEEQAFSESVCNWALHLNLLVLRYLSDKLCRPKHIHSYVRPIVIPTP